MADTSAVTFTLKKTLTKLKTLINIVVRQGTSLKKFQVVLGI